VIKLWKDGRKPSIKRWYVEGKDLRRYGMRAPAGWTFEISPYNGLGNYFHTTNRFAAYLFYKRYGIASNEVVEDFKDKITYESYLYNLSYATRSDQEFKSPDGLEYRPYQKSSIEYCQLTDNTLIADNQRLGKTIISLGLINNQDDIKKVLVVCPKIAKSVWLNESKKWLVNPMKTQVLTARSHIDPEAELIITNYDNLHIQSKLTRIPFDLVIADEIHTASRERNRRTKFFQAISAKKKLGLSGTPLLNNPIDFLTVLQWIDPLWKEFYIYKDKFSTKSGITLTLEEVQELARSTCMVRRVQAQVFKNEPTERRIVTLETTDEIKDLVGRQLKFVDFATTSRKLGISKVPAALSYFDAYISEGDKIVAFCWHKEVIDRLQASLGSKAVTINGDIPERDREKAKERFNNDPTCQVLLGSIGAASMALNLSVSNQIVFVEMDWSNGMMEQAEERCSDNDQKRQVMIEYLVYPDSLDYQKLNKISFKDDRVDRAIDLIY
jgi:SWI/SNF-related matrix-associated actin-dependent regulator 1 of chromatin subfamily A